MYDKGSQRRKRDLHTHTFLDHERNGKPTSNTPDEKKKFAAEFVKTAKEQGLGLIAITDHNFCNDVDELVVNEIKEEAKKHNIVILPGFEITTTDGSGVHILVIFDEQTDLELIKKIVDQCFDPGEDLRPETGVVPTSKKNLKQIIELLDSSKVTYEIIFAHIDSDKGVLSSRTFTGSNRVKFWQNKNVGIAQVSKDPSTFPDSSTGKMINGKDKNYKKKMAFITASDCRSLTHAKKKDGRRILGENVCWIKGDPTIHGLQHIKYEPSTRVAYTEPEILQSIKAKGSKYIKSLHIKCTNPKRKGRFQDVQIELNPELVCIIGNKGSGKSAITDIISLAGNSYLGIAGSRDKMFSFLTKERFCNSKDKFSEDFEAEITWCDGTSSIVPLNSLCDKEKVERVKYLPQKHFENICSGIEKKKFRNEIMQVVFERLDDTIRNGHDSFDALVGSTGETVRERIRMIQTDMEGVNQNIISLQQKLDPSYLKKLKNKLLEKNKELHNLTKNPVSKPRKPRSASKQQQGLSKKLVTIAHEIDQLNKQKEQLELEKSKLSVAIRDLRGFQKAIGSIQVQISNLQKDHLSAISMLKFSVNDLFKIDQESFDKIDELILTKKNRISEIDDFLMPINEIKEIEDKTHRESIRKNSIEIKLKAKCDEETKLSATIGKPQKEYQVALEKRKKYEQDKKDIIGSKTEPETIKGLEFEIKYASTSGSLHKDLKKLYNRRSGLTKQIFEEKLGLLELFEDYLQPIRKLIQEHKGNFEKGHEMGIEVGVECAGAFRETFTSYINKTSSGVFRGEQECFEKITEIVSKYDFNDYKQVKSFHAEIVDQLNIGAENGYIHPQIRNGQLQDFYDYIFGLDYLDPTYNLQLEGKLIDQLSPGQRGALLLIFYLMLDQRDIPLIVDQPEDNLDNQSVSRMLIPFIQKAKIRRQIIIVTHNPNLAVVADAEQVIYTEINQVKNNAFKHESGSIESPLMNKRIIDILEGTKPSFDQRKLRYGD